MDFCVCIKTQSNLVIIIISKPMMEINSQNHNLLGNQISSQSEDFVFWLPFWIQNGHHSKPTMDINSQHHNLFGNQIWSKSEDFSILATILDSRWPSKFKNEKNSMEMDIYRK
jgi:hypothetical protein